jgi:hypothetical protein
MWGKKFIFIFIFGFPSARTRECIHADVGPVRMDEEEKRIFYFFIFLFFLCLRGCKSHPHGRTYVLTFFLGGWKCEWELI